MNRREVLERIAQEIKNCKKCPLYETRKNPVPGEGNIDAEIMFVGEAPGTKEDVTGKPFVGSAGKLLNKLLESIGLKREDVYITNVVKCRPPNNRDPRKEEILACSPYLDRQILAIKPKLIVSLGKHSASYLLSKANIKVKSIMQMHGKFFEIPIKSEKFCVLVTLHPAAALYNPRWRSILEKDFLLIKQFITQDRKPKINSTLLKFLNES